MTQFKKYDRILGWLVFLFATIVYLMTMEPSVSLWDCPEFTATAHQLQVGHPPGAPLSMMIMRLFTMFAPEPAIIGTSAVGALSNAMSCVASGFCIMFLFWTITHLGRRLSERNGKELNKTQTYTILGAGLIGAIAYALTDTFWFSAVESEVYAMSSLFTALVVWAMLKWEEVADEPRANRWLVLIAYLMGLSIGVHILNLLAIPALVFIYYFRKSKKITGWRVIGAAAISGLIILFINSVIIPHTTGLGAFVDRVFVNSFGLPINLGFLFFAILLFGILGLLVYWSYKKGKVVLNTIMLCLTVIMIGYSSYAAILIRANANTPMNSNNPKNPYGLLYLLNRDQYGNKPLLYGAQFGAPVISPKYSTKYFVDDKDGKYHRGNMLTAYEYPSEFEVFFPRMWSESKQAHMDGYREWGQIKNTRRVTFEGQRYTIPTARENMRFFFSYQLNFMYWRYFLWNFVGRQSDNQSIGEITDGQWLSGIKVIDQLYLGPQDNLPREMENNKGRNTYFFLPFLLGIIGLVYQLNRDPKNFTVVMWLFFMTGIMLVIYFNTPPAEVRERDYIYSGSFYAFAIWIGLGVMCIKDWLAKMAKKDAPWTAIAATAICAVVPIILGAQNWDDHDRSHRTYARDMGYSYLESALPNSILLNYGDNDTFPLWYNQEVEGIRPDVRIMNISYLGGEWYIDQMKSRFNDSDPVPFSLPQSKYTYANDYIGVEDIFESATIHQVMDFLKSDDPRTQIPITEKTTIDFIPTRKILLPVNKQNAIDCGIVKEEDAHLMVDTIVINLSGNSLYKPNMMLLDMLSNIDWDRPICTTQPSSLAELGLTEYLQFDGMTYRLVPIKTPYNSKDNRSIGRIDADYVHDKLMNVFRYGNLSDKRVYVDSFVDYFVGASNIRTAFSRLATELASRGEREKAIEVLDYALTQMPVEHFRWSSYIAPFITAYYEVEEFEKGDKLLIDYMTNSKEYVIYYDSFPESKMHLVADALDYHLGTLANLYHIAKDNGRLELAKEIESFFYMEDEQEQS